MEAALALVVCAIRGGPHSLATQEYALSLAHDGGQELAFLHVVEQSLLDFCVRVRSQGVLREMVGLAELTLGMAQERARRAQVAAGADVRVGHVSEQILAYVRDRQAAVLVLGQPCRDHLPHCFGSPHRLGGMDRLGEERVEDFASQVESLTSTRVVLVPDPASGMRPPEH
jgi:nucleotide-binding universal stress UspA family protein